MVNYRDNLRTTLPETWHSKRGGDVKHKPATRLMTSVQNDGSRTQAAKQKAQARKTARTSKMR